MIERFVKKMCIGKLQRLGIGPVRNIGVTIMIFTIKKMTKLIFGKYDIARVYAEPYSRNIGSRAALEKSGYHLEAILGKNIYINGELIDSCFYSLLKENRYTAAQVF